MVVEAALPENSAVRTDGVTMTGNYAATTVPKNAYFISGNMFYRADVEGAVSLKGFRAYVTLDAPAEVNRLLIDMGRDATGIGGVAEEEADPLVDVYSMDGVRLRHGVRKSVAVDGLPEGIYVVGREKVLK